MTFDKEINIKFDEVEKRMHYISKKSSDNTIKIKNMEKNIQNLSGELNSDNFFAANKTYFFKRAFNAAAIDKILFLCNPSFQTKITIKVDATLHSYGSQFTSTLYLMINEATSMNAIASTKFIYNQGSTDHTFEIEYYGYLPKKDNFVFMRLTAGTTNADLASVEVHSAKVEISGKDIIILNKNNDFKVFISKDHYYLTKISSDGEFYSKVPNNNVSLNSFIKIPDLIPKNVSTYNNRYFPFNHTYIPKIIYNDTSGKYQIDNSVDFFAFCVNYANTVTSGASNFVDGVASLVNWSDRGFNYHVSHPIENGLYPQSLVFTYTGNLSGDFPGRSISNNTTIDTKYLSLNGTNLAKSWASMTSVFAKDWEDNPNRPLMLVGSNHLGEVYFFNDIFATYSVFLGKGRQVTAFLQPDENINVYFNWMDKTYKRTLILNTETNEYEVTEDISIFQNVSEIIEGYSNGFFVADLNRNWNYYENLNNFIID